MNIDIEELQNVRRILERGLRQTENTLIIDKSLTIDIFQHALNLLENAGIKK